MGTSKYKKRLTLLEMKVAEIHNAKQYFEDYIKWCQDHPVPDNDSKITFEQWLDSMPHNLIPCFQKEIRRMFPFLSIDH